MLLVIDGNNVAWAGFHGLRRPMGADTPEKLARAAVLGLAQGLLGLVARGGGPPGARATEALTAVAVAFDEGRPLRRRAVFPGYQMGREATPAFGDNEPYVLAAIDEFIALAANLPITILRGTNTEADDLAATLTINTPGPVRIASTDRDFLQLVDDRVTVYAPVKRLLVTVRNFAEATAPVDSSGTPSPFPRERYLDYRAASGDASDDLPGIPGVGPLSAARMLRHAPMEDYFKTPRLAARVLGRRLLKLESALTSGEARAIFARNRSLMDLRAAAVHFGNLDGYATRGHWDEPVLQSWLAAQRIAGLDAPAVVRAMAALASRPAD